MLNGVPAETAMSLLSAMVLSREIEDRVHSLYRQSRIRGRVISGRGQEAIPVGATAALQPDDIVAPVHRDLGAHLVKGTTPETVMLHYFGRAAGPSRGRDGDIHFGEWNRGVFPMVSHLPDSWPVIAGVSLSFALRKQPRVALAFCGDGATSTGAWHEAINFSSVFETPVVFVIENNQYAYSTPTTRQYKVSRLADRAAAYGIPGVHLDGNDVIAMYKSTSEAVERARNGGGPTLIEAETMRLDGHAIHDGAEYVDKHLLEQARKNDPIDRLIPRLLEAGIDQERLDSTFESAKTQASIAIKTAEQADEPDPSELEHGVFSQNRRSPVP